jgi:hypothetical protein
VARGADREQVEAAVIHVTRMTWGDGIVTVDYTQDEHIREVGGRPVMIHHQVIMDEDHPDFEVLQEVRDALHDLVRDVTAEWLDSKQWKEPEDEPDDDEDDDHDDD